MFNAEDRRNPALVQAEADFQETGGTGRLVVDLLSLLQEVGGEEEDEYGELFRIDCRIQYHNGNFHFRTGDSSYDLDCRGHWGYGCVVLGMTQGECEQEAKDLIEQVYDSIAQSS